MYQKLIGEIIYLSSSTSPNMAYDIKKSYKALIGHTYFYPYSTLCNMNMTENKHVEVDRRFIKEKLKAQIKLLPSHF